MHRKEGLEPSVTGGSKQLDFQSLIISVNIHTFPRCLLCHSAFSWNQEINPQFKTVKFHPSKLLTKHGETMVFILQSSIQRELKKKKIAGINPPTSISVLLLCNYPCMGRHTKEEENMVPILKELAILWGRCFSALRLYENHLGRLREMQIVAPTLPPNSQCVRMATQGPGVCILSKQRGFWWGLGFRTSELKRGKRFRKH